MTKEGPRFSANRLQAWLITWLIGLVVFDVAMAVVRAYLPLIVVLLGLVLIVRVLWSISR